jgi:hypothetical protein
MEENNIEIEELSGEELVTENAVIIEDVASNELISGQTQSQLVEPQIDPSTIQAEKKGNLYILVLVIAVCAILAVALGILWGKKSANI